MMPKSQMHFLLDIHSVYAIAKNPDPVRNRRLYEDVQALIHIRDWAARGHARLATTLTVPKVPVDKRSPAAEKIIAEFWEEVLPLTSLGKSDSVADVGPRSRKIMEKLERLVAVLRLAGHDPGPVLAAEREGIDLITTDAALISLCAPAKKNGLRIDVMRPTTALDALKSSR